MPNDDTPNLPATQNTAVAASASAYDFSPRTFQDAMDLAKMLAESSMVPKDFRNQPGSCFIAMQWGAEVGFKPLQAIQNIAVINGKPGLYGDAGKALLLANGYWIDEDDTETIKANSVASCTITAPNGRKVTRTFSVQNAKDAGLWKESGDAVWFRYRYRQMAWRAFWFAARDAAANVLRGMGGVEELRDMEPERDVTAHSTAEITSSATATSDASKSARVVAGLKKADVTLADIQQAFAKAMDKDSLAAAIELAKKLPESAGPDAKVAANAAYHEAKKRIFPASGPTIDDVRKQIAQAKTVDAIAVAESLIDGLDAPDDLKAAMHADAKTLRNDLAKE